MMEDAIRFCSHCGEELSNGDRYCTMCGEEIVRSDVSGYKIHRTSTPGNDDKPIMPTGLSVAYYLTAIYGILMIISLAFVPFILSSYDSLERSLAEDYDPFLADYLYYSYEGIIIEAIVNLVSGSAALLASWYCSKAVKHNDTVILLATASLVNILVLITGYPFSLIVIHILIGLIMTYIVYTNKGYFRS